ncbi:H-NS family nucleoid-associated regulatory protein [Aquabacterium sp. A7-Y]|uniref:H-NS histone family protein n=1 Tax=Aquabacterium sp. A7-Y TaxID=1349605 RepID=UPI0039FC8356
MEVARRREGAGVLKEIKKQIALYGFTAEGVFGGEQKARAPKKPEPNGSASAVPKYQDANGNSWSGRGPRPRWLRAALENGEALESFLAKPDAEASAIADDEAPASARTRRAGVKTAAARRLHPRSGHVRLRGRRQVPAVQLGRLLHRTPLPSRAANVRRSRRQRPRSSGPQRQYEPGQAPSRWSTKCPIPRRRRAEADQRPATAS